MVEGSRDEIRISRRTPELSMKKWDGMPTIR